jgi:hypothetical protein
VAISIIDLTRGGKMADEKEVSNHIYAYLDTLGCLCIMKSKM